MRVVLFLFYSHLFFLLVPFTENFTLTSEKKIRSNFLNWFDLVFVELMYDFRDLKENGNPLSYFPPFVWYLILKSKNIFGDGTVKTVLHLFSQTLPVIINYLFILLVVTNVSIINHNSRNLRIRILFEVEILEIKKKKKKKLKKILVLPLILGKTQSGFFG